MDESRRTLAVIEGQMSYQQAFPKYAQLQALAFTTSMRQECELNPILRNYTPENSFSQGLENMGNSLIVLLSHFNMSGGVGVGLGMDFGVDDFVKITFLSRQDVISMETSNGELWIGSRFDSSINAEFLGNISSPDILSEHRRHDWYTNEFDLLGPCDQCDLIGSDAITTPWTGNCPNWYGVDSGSSEWELFSIGAYMGIGGEVSITYDVGSMKSELETIWSDWY